MSAYIEKAKPDKIKAANQSQDVQAPLVTSDNVAENTAFIDYSIPNSAQTVNTPQGNTVVENSQVARSDGNTRVRGYNESITQKSDLPTEIKNEC